MTVKKVDPTLMQAGEEAFWDRMEELEKPEERYYLVDRRTGEVIVENARLTKEKKKIKV